MSASLCSGGQGGRIQEFLPGLIEHVNKLHETEKHYHHAFINALNGEMQEVNRQVDRLTDLLINETITKEAYDRKFAELQAKRKEISAKQEEHQGGNEEFKTALVTMLSLASKAPEIFKSSKISLKRSLVSLVFSNLTLSGGNLQWDLHEPFKGFLEVSSYKEWRWHH